MDDNLIGNKKAVKAFLPELAKWVEARDYPFEFVTEASINLADDHELLMLMNQANFVGVFVGIESPDTAALLAMRKKQNTRRNIAQSIHTIYAAGLFVHAGFIVGFDSETQSVADAMIELIEEAAIPVCMVGLLYALPNTQLTRRLEKEGRLPPQIEREDRERVKSADQCTMGLNFVTLRPRQEILADYVRILERIYDPVTYAGRLQRLAKMLDNCRRKTRTQHWRRKMLHRIVSNPRDLFSYTLTQCVASNPDSTRRILLLMALYMDVGAFSREVIARIENMMAALGPVVIEPRTLVERTSSKLAM